MGPQGSGALVPDVKIRVINSVARKHREFLDGIDVRQHQGASQFEVRDVGAVERPARKDIALSVTCFRHPYKTSLQRNVLLALAEPPPR